MRARNIKPGFFTNELLGTYDPIVSLLFAGLWCLADRDGRLEDRPLRIKGELFPYRDGLDINGYLTVLERDGFIARYEYGGKGYIQVESFYRHQTPHHTEKSRGLPAKPQQIQHGDGKDVLTPLSNGECKVSERSDLFIHGFTDSLIPDSKEPPKPPEGATLAKRKTRERKQEITLNDWLGGLGELDPIQADDPLLAELEAGGIPQEFVEVAWFVFVRDWGAKSAKDWPATFRNAIRRGWIKIWYFDGNGDCRLNAAGELARRSMAHG